MAAIVLIGIITIAWVGGIIQVMGPFDAHDPAMANAFGFGLIAAVVVVLEDTYMEERISTRDSVIIAAITGLSLPIYLLSETPNLLAGIGWWTIGFFSIGSTCSSLANVGCFLLDIKADRQNRLHEKATEYAYENFFDDVGNDDEFQYDESTFSGRESSAGSSAGKSMPYGIDKRHPDDAKLWAVVDDPAASDSERKKAFDTILKNQAMRQKQLVKQ
ncbi:MAG: hypothetical protein GY761_16075 [Hyphomicrobiales bacterium]|nr:hypothetical protein [Hyphomicrobiales bacterium]